MTGSGAGPPGAPRMRADGEAGGPRRRRVVAVVARPGTTAATRPLVAALARHVDVRALGRAPDPDAVLVTHPRALDRAPPGRPTAVIDGGVVRVGDVGLALPGPAAVSTAAAPPLAPHVRRRWRQRLELDPHLIVQTAALAPDDVPTGLAVAAAAVVDGSHLPLALALGCPVVTDEVTASAVGAVAQVHVVLGSRAEAELLARDERRAAGLSRRAHELARDSLDPDVTVGRLLRLWGWPPSDLTACLGRALDELGTGGGATIRGRGTDALAFSRPTSPT